jgi:4,5-DOPA dioxygenase extradiol
MIRRRDLLRAVVSAPLVSVACRQEPTMNTMPVIFLAHGAPMLLDDQGWMGELAAWAKALPRPNAILMVSAHWDERPFQIGATVPVPLVYDFYGFPEKFYRIQYGSPGAPELAARVEELMRSAGRAVERSDRGLDHGAYIPLMAMYPQADVPVLQVSLPGLDAKDLFELGRQLAPLRKEGVLVVGSGFLTHNMREGFQGKKPAGWAVEFDDWARDALVRRDADSLIDFMSRAPSARRALPTWEHYAPVLVSAGAVADDAATQTSFPISGWWEIAPSFSKRSVQFS